MENLTPKEVKELYKAHKYPLFEKGDFNLNLFGIRSPNRVADSFDDTIGCFYKHKGEEKVLLIPATIDAGAFYMKNPMNPDGCAFVCEGYYPGLWYWGKYHAKNALIQKGIVKYYRDNNRDLIIDLDPKTLRTGGAEIGYFLHPHFQPGNTATRVANSSAMCAVPQSNDDFNKLFYLVQMQVNSGHGNSFSWAVFGSSSEIPNNSNNKKSKNEHTNGTDFSSLTNASDTEANV
jgi:hypothetical protein